MMNGSLKDQAFREWVSSMGYIEECTPAQLELFMQGYTDFMEGYNDTAKEDEAEPQST